MKFWTDREPREKLLIGIALCLAAVVLCVQFVFKPLSTYPDQQKLKLEQAERDLSVMESGQAVLSGPAPIEKQSLAPNQAQLMITQSASTKGLQISRRQPNGETGLTVWLENADSRLFYSWVADLTETYDIELLSVNLGRNDDGTIRAQLTFKMGA